VVVWLWDASGSYGDYAGVTDDEGKALSSAETLLTEGRASTARVEQAYAHIGGLWIKSGYQRTGAGWSAARTDDNSARWVPLSPVALAAS
jgi:hypothetical protein